MRVQVAFGGFSSEKAQSEENGLSVAKALRDKGHEVLLTEYSRSFASDIDHSADCVFLAVQGKLHGDGTAQALLDLAGVPYSGAKAPAAALINNKLQCKRVWHCFPEIITPDFFGMSQKDYLKGEAWFHERVADIGGYPVVAKSVSQGASLGIEWIKSEADYAKLPLVLPYDDVILIEKFVNSRYLTQPLVEIEGTLTAFPIVEAVSLFEEDEFRKYNGKYSLSIADIDEALREQIGEMSKAAFLACEARGYARLDYCLSHEDGKPYLLEINAVPGMTDNSLVPYSCRHAGLDRPELLEHILRASLEKIEE